MSKNTGIRFGMIIAAAIMLCNPNINLVDIIPDFIAYMLLALAITYPADAMPYFDEARSGFIKLMWINISKIPALFLMMRIWADDSSQKSIVTVFALSYAVIELIFAIPTFKNFFDGISYLGERYGCDEVLICPPSLGKVTPNIIAKITTAFIFVKTAMSVLPEFSLVSVAEYGGTDDGVKVIISQYYGLFVVIGAALAIVAGLIWVSYFITYILHLQKCEKVNEVIADFYKDRGDYLTGKRKYSRIALITVLFLVAVGFGIDLVFDNYNVLPDTVSTFIFIFAFIFAIPFSQNAKKGAYITSIYTVFTTAAYTVSCIFLGKYKYSDIAISSEASSLHTVFVILTAIESLLYIAVIWYMIKVLCDITNENCGKLEPLHDKTYLDAENEYRHLVNRKAKLLIIPCSLTAAADFAQSILLGYTKNVEVDEAYTGLLYTTLPRVEWFWLVPLILSFISLAAVISHTVTVRENAEKHFEL